MGRWNLLSATAMVLYGSVVLAGLSTNQKELERAAELAVERAAEKAAERAVEKALNSGNSSTVTVTVKESYSNAMKTAEEQAAPGSQSTRPYNPQIYDRQYGYAPGEESRDADASAEAEELGISKESLNSSVENAGGSGEKGVSEAQSSAEAAGMSFESAKDEGGKSTESPGETGKTGQQLEASGDFAGDFSGPLSLSEGDFGLKSNTKTFSSSYSKTKDDFPETKVEVDDEEDAEIFKMYAGDFEDGGWSSTKQEGWVRHRPLWDDNKSRVGRAFWEEFVDMSAGRDARNKGSRRPPKEGQKVVKRMASPGSGQIALPVATLSLDAKTPAALYQLLKREIRLPRAGATAGHRLPMQVYLTIPVRHLPGRGHPRRPEFEGSPTSRLPLKRSADSSIGLALPGTDFPRLLERPQRSSTEQPPDKFLVQVADTKEPKKAA